MLKVLLISAYPIQNAAPLRLLSADLRLQVDTVYLADPNGNLAKGKEFINQGQFDIEVLDDTYRWELLPNNSWKPNLSGFFGLINTALFKLVPRYDCIVVYGHAYLSFWIAIVTAFLFRKKLIFTTDATYVESPEGGAWKSSLKRVMFQFLYNHLANAVWVPSTASKNFLLNMGVKSENVVITPYTVDNDFILANQDKIPREALRAKYDIPSNAFVFVFCAKFIPRKRPQDAIEAFEKAAIPNSYLLLIGDGPLRQELEKMVKGKQIEQRIRWAGLVKYSDLPSHYSASDTLVFTSETEQFGLPVNEAMLCGIPVVLSDRIGCRHDLVTEGQTGYTYPCGDIDAIAEKFILISSQPAMKEVYKKACMEKILTTWSPAINAHRSAASILRLFNRNTQ